MINNLANTLKSVDFIVLVNTVISLINSYKLTLGCWWSHGEQLNHTLDMYYMALSTLEGFSSSYSGNVMKLGKHITWCAEFFVWKKKRRESYLVMGEASERKRKTFCMRSYFRIGMGPWGAQQAKESWKAIKKKLLSTAFYSVNHRLLKRLKTTSFLHINDAPFICTGQDSNRFKLRSICILFFWGSCSHWSPYLQHVAICTACFCQNFMMNVVVKLTQLQNLKACTLGSTMSSG